jgi:hypothetical protein
MEAQLKAEDGGEEEYKVQANLLKDEANELFQVRVSVRVSVSVRVRVSVRTCVRVRVRITSQSLPVIIIIDFMNTIIHFY